MLSYETERQTENGKRRYRPSGQKDVQTTVNIGVVLQNRETKQRLIEGHRSVALRQTTVATLEGRYYCCRQLGGAVSMKQHSNFKLRGQTNGVIAQQ